MQRLLFKGRFAVVNHEWPDEYVVELGEYLTSPKNRVTKIIITRRFDYRVLEKGLTHPNSKVKKLEIHASIGVSDLNVLRSILTSPGCKLGACGFIGIHGVDKDARKEILRDIISHPNFRTYELRIWTSNFPVAQWANNRRQNKLIYSKTLFEMCTELLIVEEAQLPIPILTLCIKDKMGAKEYYSSGRPRIIINYLLHLLNNV